jgi:hypothetical protein
MTQPVSGTFAAAGQSSSFKPVMRVMAWGEFNIFLSGTAVATVELERSYNSGTTWHKVYAGGTQLYTWSYNSINLSETAEEPEPGVVYRLNCTAYTSGTVTYRISQ